MTDQLRPYKNLSMEELKQREEDAYTDYCAATGNTGSANYGYGVYKDNPYKRWVEIGNERRRRSADAG